MQIIKGLIALLVLIPIVGVASILLFGVWTAFAIMLVMGQTIRWKKDSVMEGYDKPNWVLEKIQEFQKNADIAMGHIKQMEAQAQKDPTSVRPAEKRPAPVPETVLLFTTQGPLKSEFQLHERKWKGDPKAPYLVRQPRCLECAMPIKHEESDCTICRKHPLIPSHRTRG